MQTYLKHVAALFCYVVFKYAKNVHVKVKSGTCYSTAYMRDSWPEAFYNLASGGWLAWANDNAAQYAAIHCPHQWTIGPAKHPADMPPPQSATLGNFIYPV